MDGIFYDGVAYDSRIKKWKVCRCNVVTHHPCEELVTGLSLYDAVVELRWRKKLPRADTWSYFAVVPNRAKVYKKETA